MIKQGYRFFAEGVDTSVELPPEASDQEHEIAEFFKIIIGLPSVAAIPKKLEVDNEDIEYPEDTVYADIPFEELVRLSKEKGFKPGFLLPLFKGLLDKKELREELRDAYSETEHRGSLLIFLITPFIEFFLWLFLFRKIEPLVVDCRNIVVIDIIEKYIADEDLNKILIHYGEGHVPGMIALLEERGWELVNLSKLDIPTPD